MLFVKLNKFCAVFSVGAIALFVAAAPPARGAAWEDRISPGAPGDFPPLPTPFRATYRIGWGGLTAGPRRNGHQSDQRRHLRISRRHRHDRADPGVVVLRCRRAFNRLGPAASAHPRRANGGAGGPHPAGNGPLRLERRGTGQNGGAQVGQSAGAHGNETIRVRRVAGFHERIPEPAEPTAGQWRHADRGGHVAQRAVFDDGHDAQSRGTPHARRPLPPPFGSRSIRFSA